MKKSIFIRFFCCRTQAGRHGVRGPGEGGPDRVRQRKDKQRTSYPGLVGGALARSRTEQPRLQADVWQVHHVRLQVVQGGVPILGNAE